MARLNLAMIAALRSRQPGDDEHCYERAGERNPHGGVPVIATIRRSALGFAIERRGEAVERFPLAAGLVAALRADETGDDWRACV